MKCSKNMMSLTDVRNIVLVIVISLALGCMLGLMVGVSQWNILQFISIAPVSPSSQQDVPSSLTDTQVNNFTRRLTHTIDDICLISNISGKVLTYDRNSWTVNKRVCKYENFEDLLFVRANLNGPEKTPIFVYEAESDIWVSGSILKYGMWERDLVNRMYNILMNDNEAVFIDIGSNVGVFSLTMAKAGKYVIAIDALSKNIARLCKSIDVGELGDNIVVIYNAVSNKHEKVALGFEAKNVGGTFLKKLNTKLKNEKNVVSTILLDDLLDIFKLNIVVIKMDVEKSEAKVLEGARKFFKTVYVSHVLLEFAFHRKSSTGPYIIKFLEEHGLVPQLSARYLNNYSNWPGEVLFVNKIKYEDFRYMKPFNASIH